MTVCSSFHFAMVRCVLTLDSASTSDDKFAVASLPPVSGFVRYTKCWKINN